MEQNHYLVLNLSRKNVGQKGQVVIPKRLRDALGLKLGVEVIIELKGIK
jgi:AbrB family looped-hinge helix DNA binding protein